jgi:hypothetical protein
MTTPRLPHRPPANAVATSFLGRLLERRTPRAYGTTGRTIDPAIFEATMTMGGWVSWEMVHFISEIASRPKNE